MTRCILIGDELWFEGHRLGEMKFPYPTLRDEFVKTIASSSYQDGYEDGYVTGTEDKTD